VRKERKTAAQLEKLIVEVCANLPIASVRVYPFWKKRFSWHARFIVKSGNSPTTIRPAFNKALERLQERYDLDNPPE
jgi:hypothetical protein